MSLSIAKFGFEDLKDHVMDFLVSVTDLKVCSIEFLHMATQTYLEDQIWDKCRILHHLQGFQRSSTSQEPLEGVPSTTSLLLSTFP